jgi:hypothetical protein
MSTFDEAIAEGDLWEMIHEFLPVVSSLNILGREGQAGKSHISV